MSWSLKDHERQRRSRAETSGELPTVVHGSPPGAGDPPLGTDLGPPLGELTMSWGEDDEPAAPAWPKDLERDLAAQGWVAERDWERIGLLMRRGVMEV